MNTQPDFNLYLSSLNPVKDALSALDGKWKLTILASIFYGNNRFSSIQNSIPDMTSKVLANELKALEHHNLIKRVVVYTPHTTVEYKITPYAETLREIVASLRTWGLYHRMNVLKSSTISIRQCSK